MASWGSNGLKQTEWVNQYLCDGNHICTVTSKDTTYRNAGVMWNLVALCDHWSWAAYKYSWDLSHKAHGALHKYPTMHHFMTEICTFLLWNGALWDMGLMHSGICATGLLWHHTMPVLCSLAIPHPPPHLDLRWPRLPGLGDVSKTRMSS